MHQIFSSDSVRIPHKINLRTNAPVIMVDYEGDEDWDPAEEYNKTPQLQSNQFEKISTHHWKSTSKMLSPKHFSRMIKFPHSKYISDSIVIKPSSNIDAIMMNSYPNGIWFNLSETIVNPSGKIEGWIYISKSKIDGKPLTISIENN